MFGDIFINTVSAGPSIINNYLYLVPDNRIYRSNLEFKKWRAIRASVGGVGGVLTWVAC